MKVICFFFWMIEFTTTFGQTAFDKVELNLGPFEQQFTENRPFFTEGTELFSKGDLFYSRRIGKSYTLNKQGFKSSLLDDEKLDEYPEKTNLFYLKMPQGVPLQKL
jgi:hypothetical protein